MYTFKVTINKNGYDSFSMVYRLGRTAYKRIRAIEYLTDMVAHIRNDIRRDSYVYAYTVTGNDIEIDITSEEHDLYIWIEMIYKEES